MIERFIAFRYLRANKGFASVVTWFSFIGIALGVATLIIVTSVMNGFRFELLEKIVGMKGHVVITKSDYSGIDDSESLLSYISNNEITNFIPQIEQQVVFIANGSARGVMAIGMSNESLRSKKLISSNIIDGTINDFKEQKILIGSRMAEQLGLKISDFVKVLIPDGLSTPFGNLPKEETFQICGIFEVGMNEYDKNIIIIPLSDAQSFFDMEKKVSQIELYLKNVDNAQKVTRSLSKQLGKGFRVLDWQHSDASIFHAVVVEKNVMSLILSIIILVAVFNIISGLTMLTNSKIKDIAILRTMGMTKESILRIFFMIGSSIGLLGTCLGIILGLLVTLNIDRIKRFLESISGSDLFNEEIYFLSQIPSRTDTLEVVYISVFAVILCFIATLYPAKKAAKLDPVEALRN